MKKSLFLISMCCLIIIAGASAFKNHTASDDYWLDFIIGRFTKYIESYHQNNLYLQTDKNEYDTSETIYFKAYIINNVTKKPENIVKNLYVELIAPDKGVFMSRLLKIENGMAAGDFPVLDTIYTGMYQLRAYTQNMKNSGAEFLFSKEIRINHPKKVYYNKIFHKKAKKIIRHTPEIDIQFFPEGGEMIDKINSVVAFKAINKEGNGTDIEGEIYSGKNKFICNFKSSHLGMGKFSLTPEYKEEYYALVHLNKKKSLKFSLPKVIQSGYSLKIDETPLQYKLTISTNKRFGNDPVAKTVYLIAQSGGKIYSSGKHLFENNEIQLDIGKKIFPSGVVQFTLFDGQGKPHCERIVFADHQDKIKIQTSLDIKQFNKRDKIAFDIMSNDDEGEAIPSSLCISVRKKSDFGENAPSIRTYLLLQSDLRGKIENPDYYFSGEPEAAKAVDLLMLTQGWRKFLWKDILADSIYNPEFPVETDLRITGRITKYLFDISVMQANITLTMLNKYNDVFKTTSGKKGYFEFTGLDYSDTIDVLIEVRTKYNKKNVLILVDESRSLQSDFYPFRDFYLDSLGKRHKSEYKKIEEEAPDPNKPEDFKIHNKADQVVKFNDQMANSGQNVLNILESRVPGLNVDNNQATMRGPTSVLLNNEPLYLMDGMPVDFGTIQSISPYDVDYVDILKGPSSAIYGMRGYNGVIAVYTKKGFYYKRGEIRFKMLGYHTPKKFYVPKYNSKQDNAQISDNRKTIFWSPNLKTGVDGRTHVEFYHSDIPGEFEIVIEGMDDNGKTGTFTQDYIVGNTL